MNIIQCDLCGSQIPYKPLPIYAPGSYGVYFTVHSTLGPHDFCRTCAIQRMKLIVEKEYNDKIGHGM